MTGLPEPRYEAVLKMRAAARLVRRGIGVLGADALLDACEQDRDLVLLTLPLPRFDGLRNGDRVRTTIDGKPKSVVVEMIERGSFDVAICGRPVESTGADDVATSLPVRRGA